MMVKIKKLRKDAIIPKYASEQSAGLDLYANIEEDISIPPFHTVKIPTGVAIELEDNTVGLIYARSGLATNRDLAPANKVGVVDSDYRGEIIVALHNHGEIPQKVAKNERIAQLVITPIIHVELEEVDELSQTKRSSGGFGSTGEK